MTEKELEQFYQTFCTLERGCVAMYNVIMQQKNELDALVKRIERLENAQNNSR